MKLLPTGGVPLATAHEYIAAVAVALGVGTELVDVALHRADGDRELTERAARFAEIVRAAREAKSAGG